MEPTKTYENELTLSIRTEVGKVSIDLGLDHLKPEQRGFIFASIAGTRKGGSAGFGMSTEPNGDIILEVTLKGPNPKKKIGKAVKQALQVVH